MTLHQASNIEPFHLQWCLSCGILLLYTGSEWPGIQYGQAVAPVEMPVPGRDSLIRRTSKERSPRVATLRSFIERPRNSSSLARRYKKLA